MASVGSALAAAKAWSEKHRVELRLSVRVVAAGLLTFVLVDIAQLPQGFWATLTAVLVVQSSLGGSLKAAADRLTGTIGGAAWGAVVAMVFPQSGTLALCGALAFGLAPLALAAALRPSLRIAPVTAVIVLFAGAYQSGGAIESAALRTLEIALGGLVGVGVSLFVLPVRAHGMVATAVGEVLGLLAELVTLLFGRASQAQLAMDAGMLHQKIRAGLSRLDNLADEARRERSGYLSNEPDPGPLLRTLRRVQHDLVIVTRCMSEPLPVELRGSLGEALESMAAILSTGLRELAKAMIDHRPRPDMNTIETAIERCIMLMERQPEAPAMRRLASTDAERIHALGFAVAQLRRNLADLQARCVEYAPQTLRGDR